MKILKYYLIFIALAAACQPNLNGMEAEEAIRLDILDEKQSLLAADEKTARSPFDIDVINQRLSNIKIDDGFFRLEEKDTAFPYERAKSIVFSVPKPTKCCRISTQNYITYEIGKTADQTPINSIELLAITPHYRNRGLATILTLVALQRGLAHASYACVDARSKKVQKIFKALGFIGNSNHLSTQDVGALLAANGQRMLDKAFAKLEYSALPCCTRAWMCCSKRVSAWFKCCAKSNEQS